MANKKIFTLIPLLVVIFFISFISMPKFFYIGDSYAVKLSAIKLVNDHDFGFSVEAQNQIASMMPSNKNQYFIANAKTGKRYSLWGVFVTAAAAIPEFFNNRTSKIEITGDSILLHNIYNIVLSVLIGFLLYQIATMYSLSNLGAVTFTLSALFSTFLFNYLRAQSYEILQVLFFLFFYYLFKKSTLKSRNYRWHILGYHLALWSLILIKNIYLLLYISLATDQLIFRKSFSVRVLLQIIVSFIVPVAIIALVNKLQFDVFYFSKPGSIFPSDPHALIPTGTSSLPGFSFFYLPMRLKDYFIDSNGSLFLHFPLLAFSLFGYKDFFKKYKHDTIFIINSFIIFFSVLLCFCTIGEWCYGPRYLLFILPILSLPVLILLDKIFSSTVSLKQKIAGFMIFYSVISYSAYLQTEFNSRNFFLKYYLSNILGFEKNAEIKSYYYETYPPLQVQDFNNFLKKKDFYYPVYILTKNFNYTDREKIYNQIAAKWSNMFECNYYFKFSCKLFLE